MGSLSESRIKQITRITRIKGESRAKGREHGLKARVGQRATHRTGRGVAHREKEKAKGRSRMKWIKQMKGGLKTRVG